MSDRDTTPADATSGSGFVQRALEPLLRAVREEVAAARNEISERASSAKAGLIMTAAGAAVALVALALLAALAVALLSLALPLWAAISITLAVFLIAAGVLVTVGLRGIRRGVPPLPKDTIARNRHRRADGAASSA